MRDSTWKCIESFAISTNMNDMSSSYALAVRDEPLLTLLLKLPTLPKEVKFRFVKKHLLLVDSDNLLIVDYALNAMP